MKKFLLFVGIMLMTYTVSAQNQQPVVPLIEVGEGIYEANYQNDDNSLSQVGFYKIVNDKLVKHGVWKMYNGDKMVTKAKFENDDLVWIKSDGVVYTSDEIELIQLRNRVSSLEKAIVSNTY
jgi:hypothetical protein